MEKNFQDAADDLKKTFENFDAAADMQAMKQTAKEAADVASDFIRKYPIQSVLGAAVVGFLLANLLKKD